MAKARVRHRASIGGDNRTRRGSGRTAAQRKADLKRRKK